MQNKQIEKLGLHNAFDSLAAPTQCTWRNINLILNIRREGTYLIFVIYFTRAKFLENKIYTKKTRKLRQNTQ